MTPKERQLKIILRDMALALLDHLEDEKFDMATCLKQIEQTVAIVKAENKSSGQSTPTETAEFILASLGA